MDGHVRLDSVTAAVVDEAIRLRDMGQHAPSLQLLSDYALGIDLIGRVLCDPAHRRGRPRRLFHGSATRCPPTPRWWHFWARRARRLSLAQARSSIYSL